MSNAFSLPIALSIAPRRRITAALIALHCLPLPALPLLATVAAPGAWLLAALVALSLALELHKQHTAGPATRLEATAANKWLLYRGAGQSSQIELLDGADFGWFTLLLAAQNGKKFRLVINANEQTEDQLHRLRVWLAQRGG